MKRFKLIAMAFAAISMFSCSKENVTEEVPLNGEEATVTLQLKGTEDSANLNSRAAGEGTTNEATVNDLVVFFFNSGDVLIGAPKFYAKSDLTDLLKITAKTTTDAKKVFIIANTGVTAANFNKSIFKSVQTKATLEAVKGDLFKDPINNNADLEASTQSSGDLWMAGSGNLTEKVSGTATALIGNVTISYVASKIIVKIIDQRTNKNLAWTTNTPAIIVDKDVSVLFAGAEGCFVGTSAEQINQRNYYSGFRSTGTAALKTALTSAITNGNVSLGNNQSFHFYVFPHQKNPPIIVSIRSDKFFAAAQSTAVATYYSALFNTNDVLKGKDAFVGGHLYTLTMTLTGDVSTGGGGGDPDPELPSTNASVDLAVTVGGWKNNIIVSKTFE